MSLLTAALLSLAAPALPRADVADPIHAWRDCARMHAEAMLAGGIRADWPVADAVPAGGDILIVPLDAYPPAPAMDQQQRTLMLVPRAGAVYITIRGGFADMGLVYGPIGLREHCPTSPGVHQAP